MPNRNQNLVGKRFGALVVERDSGLRGKANAKIWDCLCDCGQHTLVSTASLNSGEIRSCGHLKVDALKKTVKKRVEEMPGTNLALLNNKKPVTNTSGEKNITSVFRSGRWRYRVAVVYKRHQYGGLRDTLEEAIEFREELRKKYWPNYK